MAHWYQRALKRQARYNWVRAHAAELEDRAHDWLTDFVSSTPKRRRMLNARLPEWHRRPIVDAYGIGYLRSLQG